MRGDEVFSVKNVSKKFCRDLRRMMYYGLKDLAGGFVGMRPELSTLRPGEFWAVDDVSFTLRRGQVLGVIGANGSGKTTLLRLVAGIYPIDRGEITVRGRLAALISLGAGFHNRFSGLENIYLNGTILGMGRAEIDRKLERIIDFSELGDFIDAPVSSYSSGMKVRLGFSVAVALEPDVLILDEVLSVGDSGFRDKCYLEIDRLAEDCAIVFVSHNMQNVERICTDVMVMDKGRKIFETHDVPAGIEAYNSRFSNTPAAGADKSRGRRARKAYS
jgi:lipopolysaccharide transport system ATP-binding protein